jgi:hypothetical protein
MTTADVAISRSCAAITRPGATDPGSRDIEVPLDGTPAAPRRTTLPLYSETHLNATRLNAPGVFGVAPVHRGSWSPEAQSPSRSLMVATTDYRLCAALGGLARMTVVVNNVAENHT